jgi:hypothetical protein
MSSSTVMPVEQEAGEVQVAKKRGRPKGSKNAGALGASKGKKGSKGKGKGQEASEPTEPPVLSVRLVREVAPTAQGDPEIVLWISAKRQRNAYQVDALLYTAGDANRKIGPYQVVKTETLKRASVDAAQHTIQAWVSEAEARGFIRRERGAKVELGWDALGGPLSEQPEQQQ